MKSLLISKWMTRATAALTLALAPLSSKAESLYDAPPSPTSAFVRFVETPQDGALVWRGQNIELPTEVLGHYIAIESEHIASAAGAYITVAQQSAGNLSEHTELARTSGKVALQLLNLSAAPVTLKTQDQKIIIFENVTTQELAARNINPLTFATIVQSENTDLGALELDIKRNSNPLIVVRADGSLAYYDSALFGANNQ